MHELCKVFVHGGVQLVANADFPSQLVLNNSGAGDEIVRVILGSFIKGGAVGEVGGGFMNVFADLAVHYRRGGGGGVNVTLRLMDGYSEYDDRDWGFREIDSLFVPNVDTGRHHSETSGGYLPTYVLTIYKTKNVLVKLEYPASPPESPTSHNSAPS